MRARLVFLAVTALLWASPSRAQYYDRERPYEHHHEHDRDRGPPPIYLLPGPRHADLAEHAPPPHHVSEPARISKGGDGPICDTPDNNPDAAIAACSRIIAHGPVKNGYSLTLAYIHRGQAHENKSDHDLAIADFSSAIGREPDVSGYFAMRGAALEKFGKLVAARNDFRRAANLDPQNEAALNNFRRIETVIAAGAASPIPGPTASPAASAATLPPLPAPASTAGAPVPPISQTASIARAPLAAPVTSAAPGTALPPSSAASAGAALPPSSAAAAGAVMTQQNTMASATTRTSSPTVVGAAGPPVPIGTAPPSGAAVAVPPPSATSNSVYGPRVALVIGNGAYVNANTLPNPPNDAHAIAGTLRKIGFDVQEGENLSYAAMASLMQDFLHKAEHASVVLLFYAGHGMQVDGKNYLIPVDAKLAEASDLPFETIEIDKLLDSLGDPGHTNIILLDACRDNPLARSFASHLPATRSIKIADGLAAYSAVGTGTLIAYATAPGQTALDGQGTDSPFTTSLLHFLPTPGLEIRQVLTRVRAEVASETGNRQIPWDNSSLMGDVVLVKQAP